MQTMKTLSPVVALLASLATASLVHAQEATNMPGGTRHAISVEAGLGLWACGQRGNELPWLKFYSQKARGMSLQKYCTKRR